MNVPRVWMLYLYIPGGTEGSEWLDWYDGAEGLDDGNPNLLAATHLYKRRRYICLYAAAAAKLFESCASDCIIPCQRIRYLKIKLIK